MNWVAVREVDSYRSNVCSDADTTGDVDEILLLKVETVNISACPKLKRAECSYVSLL